MREFGRRWPGVALRRWRGGAGGVGGVRVCGVDQVRGWLAAWMVVVSGHTETVWSMGCPALVWVVVTRIRTCAPGGSCSAGVS